MNNSIQYQRRFQSRGFTEEQAEALADEGVAMINEYAVNGKTLNEVVEQSRGLMEARLESLEARLELMEARLGEKIEKTFKEQGHFLLKAGIGIMGIAIGLLGLILTVFN